jgi:hypothetical protein
MTIPQRTWAALSVALLGSLSVVAGCYRPNIAQGGFVCAAGSVCPDGFHCLTANNRCYQGDAGPEAPSCSATQPVATCSTGPASGQTCNPNCQMGCSCGFCGMANGATTCLTVTAGKSDIGDLCDPRGQAPCKAGLFCKPECTSTDPSLGRCYKYCAQPSDCQICDSDGSCQTTTCTVGWTSAAPSGSPSLMFKLCSLPPQQCNPISTTTGGCPATNPAAFACYADSDQTFCDCQGTLTPSSAQGCTFVGQCVPGYTCVRLSATAPGSCHPACQSNADCTSPATCNFLPGESVYGYCL